MNKRYVTYSRKTNKKNSETPSIHKAYIGIRVDFEMTEKAH